MHRTMNPVRTINKTLETTHQRKWFLHYSPNGDDDLFYLSKYVCAASTTSAETSAVRNSGYQNWGRTFTSGSGLHIDCSLGLLQLWQGN